MTIDNDTFDTTSQMTSRSGVRERSSRRPLRPAHLTKTPTYQVFFPWRLHGRHESPVVLSEHLDIQGTVHGRDPGVALGAMDRLGVHDGGRSRVALDELDGLVGQSYLALSDQRGQLFHGRLVQPGEAALRAADIGEDFSQAFGPQVCREFRGRSRRPARPYSKPDDA